jgi:hypothetical protein
MSRRNTMSKLDEELEGRFRGLERPVFVDPDLFTRLVQRRFRRERAKRVGALAVVVALVAVGAGGFALLSGSDRGGAEPATSGPPSFTSQPAVAASLPGVPFPACHVSSVHNFMGTSPYGGIVYMFSRGTSTGACPDVDAGNAYIALDRRGQGNANDTQVFGPIDCFKGCRVFGTPDLDGDAKAELAVVVVDGNGADSIELYRMDPNSDPPFQQINTIVSHKPMPVFFDWGGGGDYRAGAVCSQSSPRTFDVWHARLRDGKWQVVQQFMRLRGTTLIPTGTGKYATSLAGNLPSGGSYFCDSTPPTP